jgi:hypothetical protein
VHALENFELVGRDRDRPAAISADQGGRGEAFEKGVEHLVDVVAVGSVLLGQLVVVSAEQDVATVCGLNSDRRGERVVVSGQREPQIVHGGSRDHGMLPARSGLCEGDRVCLCGWDAG